MTVALIGAGNVAVNLGLALRSASVKVEQVWSRNIDNATDLAHQIGANAITRLDHIDTDLAIIAVKDDAIDDVLQKMTSFSGLIAHTSGAVDLDIFQGHFENYGVLYPLQTFSKTRKVDFATVPMCLEANSEKNLQILWQLATILSRKLSQVNSQQRKILHVAAVFACNFPNYLFGKADELLAENGLDFELLRPLILETALKIQENAPKNVQTGPAIRNDEKTMQAHLQLLKGNKNLTDIYTLLSESIKSGK